MNCRNLIIDFIGNRGVLSNAGEKQTPTPNKLLLHELLAANVTNYKSSHTQVSGGRCQPNYIPLCDYEISTLGSYMILKVLLTLYPFNLVGILRDGLRSTDSF